MSPKKTKPGSVRIRNVDVAREAQKHVADAPQGKLFDEEKRLAALYVQLEAGEKHRYEALAQTLGMTADDVYQAYLKKNQVNHQRQESGYVKKDEADSKHI